MVGGSSTPVAFRRALEAVPPLDRDAWLDRELGLDAVAEDGARLPRGCVPYLPCSVSTLLDVVDAAGLGHGDVFVDIGAGVGRAMAAMHWLTGARCIGLEIQPDLVRAARSSFGRLGLSECTVIEGDAAELTEHIQDGTVFLLYCPFGGDRLARVLDALEPIAKTRQIHVACVDLPLPSRGWLAPVASPSPELELHRSRAVEDPHVALSKNAAV